MLDEAIEAWTPQRDVEEVLAALGEADVPSGRIYTAEDIFDDVHYRARGMIEHAPMPGDQPIDLPGIVPKLNETPGATRWVGPRSAGTWRRCSPRSGSPERHWRSSEPRGSFDAEPDGG